MNEMDNRMHYNLQVGGLLFVFTFLPFFFCFLFVYLSFFFLFGFGLVSV